MSYGFVTMSGMKKLMKAFVFLAVMALGSQVAAAQENRVTILFTGHIIGNYEPCG